MMQMSCGGVNVTPLTKEDVEEDASRWMGVAFRRTQLTPDSPEQTAATLSVEKMQGFLSSQARIPQTGKQEFPLPTSQGIFIFSVLFLVLKHAAGPRA